MLTQNWDNIMRGSVRKVRLGRINKEVRRRMMFKHGHLLTTPAIVKSDGTRIKPVCK